MAKYRQIWGSGGKKSYYRCMPGNEPDVEITKEEYDAACPSKIEDLLKAGTDLAFQQPGAWPKESFAMGCLASEVPAMMEHDKKLGVSTEYVKTEGGYGAQPVFTSRQHRKQYLKAHGRVDNSGGYGD